MTKATYNSIVSVFILFLILFGFIFVIYKIGFLRGVLFERASRICVSEYELTTYRNTLETASLVCIGVQEYRSNEVTECQKETNKWKDKYIWAMNRPIATSTVLN